MNVRQKKKEPREIAFYVSHIKSGSNRKKDWAEHFSARVLPHRKIYIKHRHTARCNSGQQQKKSKEEEEKECGDEEEEDEEGEQKNRRDV